MLDWDGKGRWIHNPKSSIFLLLKMACAEQICPFKGVSHIRTKKTQIKNLDVP